MGNSEEVVRKVAMREDMQPEEVEPLYKTVDPDALDKIFSSDQQSGVVVFSYMGYEVMVASNGTVTIE